MTPPITNNQELRNTLLLDILHDTNVSDEHIEKLADLITQRQLDVLERVNKRVIGKGIKFDSSDDETKSQLLNRFRREQCKALQTIKQHLTEDTVGGKE